MSDLSLAGQKQINNAALRVGCWLCFMINVEGRRSRAIWCMNILHSFQVESYHYFNSLLVPESSFIESPQPMNVSAGKKATFQCQHSTSNSIGWKLNGTSLNDYAPPNTSVITFPTSNGDIINRLIITAFPHYNETQVVCFARFTTQGLITVDTTPVLLLIQGRLDRVTTLRRVTSLQQLLYTWQPPYSLDLTAVMPDVVSCIDVFKITCGVREHVISQCGIANHSYQVSHETLDTADLYEAIVIPRSNIANASNGTHAIILDRYITVSDNNWTLSVIGEDNGNITIQLNIKLNPADFNVTPDSFAVFLTTVDNENIERQMCISSQFPLSTATLDEPLECLLPPRRLWMATLHVGRCVEEKVSNAKELSTHDIQITKISVHNNNHTNATSASVIGEFINDSTAVGVLMIMYSELSSSGDTHVIAKVVVTRPSFQVNFLGLKGNLSYNVCAFVVDENGLPLECAATFARPVPLSSSTKCVLCDTAQPSQEPLITARMNISSERNETCIHCALIDKHVSSCVVIVFDKVSYTFSATTTKVFIFDSKANRSDILGCIDDGDFNITRQLIIVFPYINGSIFGSGIVLQNENSKTENNTNSITNLHFLLTIVLPSAAGSALIIIIILVLTVIGLRYWYRKKYSKAISDQQNSDVPGAGIQMQKCDAYEDINLHRKRTIITEENTAYGVVITN